MEKRMVQYSVWPNCNNNCKFCLRKERDFYTLDQQFKSLENIKKNISCIDWTKFPYGVSLLGGEVFNIQDRKLQECFLNLVRYIIENVLKKSNVGIYCKLSTVTNGIYNPKFLFEVADLISENIGMDYLDLNFSFDIKYRYADVSKSKIVLDNINDFHSRYNYRVGVQMILTQYFIDAVRNNTFDINDFLINKIPGNILTFLYPHPIATGYILGDFNFKRKDFLWFLQYLRNTNYEMYLNFVHSTKNSSIFKYTGLRNKFKVDNKSKDFDIDVSQFPVLSDGKEEINQKCKHSKLYQCYSDTDKCMLCDILNFDKDIC